MTHSSTTTPRIKMLRRSKLGLRALARDERGMSSVEYIILMVIVVVGSVGLWNNIGTKVHSDLKDAKKGIEKIKSH